MERDLQEIVRKMVIIQEFRNKFLDPAKRKIILKRDYTLRLSPDEIEAIEKIVAKDEYEFAQALTNPPPLSIGYYFDISRSISPKSFDSLVEKKF